MKAGTGESMGHAHVDVMVDDQQHQAFPDYATRVRFPSNATNFNELVD